VTRRGSALIGVLWLAALLALMATGLAARGRLAARRLGRAVEAVERRALLVSGLALARRDAVGPHDARPAWNAPERFRDAPVPGGRVTVSHDADGTTMYGLGDEAGRLNLNTAPDAAIRRFFADAPAVASAVLDWRDADGVARTDGAEAGAYADEGHGCRNGTFRAPEELLLVRGVDGAIYREAARDVTLWGDGRVNVNTARPRVLAAVGLPERLVEKIRRARLGPDGRWGTADDIVFRDPVNGATVAGRLMAAGETIDAVESAAIDAAAPALSGRMGFRRAVVEAARAGDPIVARATAVFPPEAAQPPVYWRDGPP
jgi:general secretion pathway protein K